MTKEIKFTSANLSYTDPAEDCYLDPSDPIHAVYGQGILGTLKPAAEQHFELRNRAQQQGIRPGTPAWFALTQTR